VQYVRKRSPMLVTFKSPFVLMDVSFLQRERNCLPMLVILESPVVSRYVRDGQL